MTSASLKALAEIYGILVREGWDEPGVEAVSEGPMLAGTEASYLSEISARLESLLLAGVRTQPVSAHEGRPSTPSSAGARMSR